jgi:hypothetical protein
MKLRPERDPDMDGIEFLLVARSNATYGRCNVDRLWQWFYWRVALQPFPIAASLSHPRPSPKCQWFVARSD